tara:strand:+ start:11089 stop:11844 length:756 start_codon:yes stop_codon:yes gene_type:complete
MYRNFILLIFILFINFVNSYIFNIGSTGLLLPYSLGILGYIKKHNIINSDELIGTSGGSYCSLLYKFENNLNSHDFIWNNIFNLNKSTKIDLYNLNKFQLRNNNILFNRYLNHSVNNLNIKIVATQYNNILDKKECVFSYYSNISDLINKCYCSSYIPYISGDKFYYKYNNTKYYDGAFNKINKKNIHYSFNNNNLIINKLSQNNNIFYINSNTWGRKWNEPFKHYLDYETSEFLFYQGWYDTLHNIDKIL